MLQGKIKSFGKMKPKNTKDLGSGLLFVGFGLAGLLLSPGYRMGTAAGMGPGYFPFLVSLGLAGLGAALCVRSLCRPSLPIVCGHPVQYRSLLLVLGTVFLFGLSLKPLGLLLSSFLLILISSAAHREWRLLESLLAALVLSVLVTALFVYGLGMPLGVWPQLPGEAN